MMHEALDEFGIVNFSKTRSANRFVRIFLSIDLLRIYVIQMM